MAAGEKEPGWLSPPDNTVYVVITTVNHDKSAAELPLLMMKKWLEQWIPNTNKNKETEAKPRRDGAIIASAENRKIAEAAIKNAKRFYDICDIQVVEMEKMNQSQGVIFGRNLLSESTEALIQDLKPKGVADIDRISSFKNGSLSPNGLHVLTFNSRRLPETILIGYVRYQVRQYFPRPLRCVRCCVYGHTRKNCREPNEICKDCAVIKHEGQCSSPLKCRNCNGSHGSFDKMCPIFKREEAIIKLKIDQGISFGYARKLYMDKVDSTKVTYCQMAMNMAEEEAFRLADEIECVREKNQRTEFMKEELKKEIKKLEEATKEILNLQRRKNVLEGILTSNQQENYMTSTQTTTPTPSHLNILTQQTGQSQVSASLSTPISQLSPQNPTTSQITSPSLTNDLFPLTTSLFRKTVQDQANGDSSDEMEYQTDTKSKRRNNDASDSETETEKEKRKKINKDEHNIGISDFANLSKSQRKQIRTEVIKNAENKISDFPMYWKKGNKIISTSPKTRQHKEQAKIFHEWVLNGKNPNSSE
jgi:hypothetical protein